MWDIDKKNYEQEEKRLRDRINKINKDNADFLLKQMAEKTGGFKKMNQAEYAINKPILREANQKFKGMSQYNPSNPGESRGDDQSVQNEI